MKMLVVKCTVCTKIKTITGVECEKKDPPTCTCGNPMAPLIAGQDFNKDD